MLGMQNAGVCTNSDKPKSFLREDQKCGVFSEDGRDGEGSIFGMLGIFVGNALESQQ